MVRIACAHERIKLRRVLPDPADQIANSWSRCGASVVAHGLLKEAVLVREQMSGQFNVVTHALMLGPRPSGSFTRRSASTCARGKRVKT